jgi:hypothetical protein
MIRGTWPWGLLALGTAFLGAERGQLQGYPPGEAAGKMKAADGFTVQLVASEPQVRQPILVKFDERGRLWVIQYLQYPTPPG